MTALPIKQGISLETHHVSWRATVQLFSMLAGITSSGSGGWIDSRNIKDGSLEFLNDAGVGSLSAFSATVMGSNALDVPDDSADGETIQTVSAVGIVALAALARWIKVKPTSVTVTGGATLGCRLHAHNY